MGIWQNFLYIQAYSAPVEPRGRTKDHLQGTDSFPPLLGPFLGARCVITRKTTHKGERRSFCARHIALLVYDPKSRKTLTLGKFVRAYSISVYF